MSNQKQKRSIAFISKDLGFSCKEAIVAWLEAWGDPEAERALNIVISQEDFLKQLFPEFSSDSPLIIPQIYQRSAFNLSLEYPKEYISAYELTYLHHYEMEEDWLALIHDSDIDQYSDISRGEKDTFKPLNFEIFELVMLCIVDKGDWTKRLSYYGSPDWQEVLKQWIIDWRIKLGRYESSTDGAWRSGVWRDNWRDVRDKMIDINQSGDSVLGILKLAEELIKERGLTYRPGMGGVGSRKYKLVAYAVRELFLRARNFRENFLISSKPN